METIHKALSLWLEPITEAVAYLGVRADEVREKQMEEWGETETKEGRGKQIK